MSELSTDESQNIKDLAKRYEISEDAVMVLLKALASGSGRMAQFSHPDLGGMEQWSHGGMIMIGDMFNDGLKSKVNNLCIELSELLQKRCPLAAEAASSVPAGESSFSFTGFNSDSMAVWWPRSLGVPSSAGAQNQLRYAYFPALRRLAIKLHDQIKVYDTGEHEITSFSQEQGHDQSLLFRSQLGLVRGADLPLVDLEQ